MYVVSLHTESTDSVIIVGVDWMALSVVIYAALCPFPNWKCDNGQCVSSSYRCNGRNDYRGCRDGSDERGCSKLTC